MVTPENPPLATPAQDEVERVIAAISDCPASWADEPLSQCASPGNIRGIAIAALSTQQPAGEVAQEREAIVAWLRTAEAIAGPGPYKSLDVPIRLDVIRNLIDAIERGDHRLGLPAAQEGGSDA